MTFHSHIYIVAFGLHAHHFYIQVRQACLSRTMRKTVSASIYIFSYWLDAFHVPYTMMWCGIGCWQAVLTARGLSCHRMHCSQLYLTYIGLPWTTGPPAHLPNQHGGRKAALFGFAFCIAREGAPSALLGFYFFWQGTGRYPTFRRACDPVHNQTRTCCVHMNLRVRWIPGWRFTARFKLGEVSLSILNIQQ